jgi:hypothetical protein
MLARGMTPQRVVLSLYTLAATFGLIALSSSRWEEWPALAGAIFITFLGYLGSQWLYDEFQLLRRGYLLPVFDSGIAQSRLMHAAWDFAAIGAAYGLARWAMPVPVDVPLQQFLLRAAAAGACGVAVLWLFGVYRFSFRRLGVWVLMRAIRGVILAVIAAAAGEVMLFRVELNFGVWLLEAELRDGRAGHAEEPLHYGIRALLGAGGLGAEAEQRRAVLRHRAGDEIGSSDVNSQREPHVSSPRLA